jgi:hypothetical protein
MTTTQNTEHAAADNPRREPAQTFDHVMIGLAAVLLLAVGSAASILFTLPEALEALATPAMGAPWMTASPQGVRRDESSARPCASK